MNAYHDLTPRGGVAIDVFGNGKTSLKVNAGKYLEAAQNGGLFIARNPTNRLATTATRTWTDTTFGPGDPRSGNFIPDSDLLNSALNGECGLSSVTNFAALRSAHKHQISTYKLHTADAWRQILVGDLWFVILCFPTAV